MQFAKTHFSQGGEDILLDNIFFTWLEYEEPGFYVDVGAFHPYHYSNTALLYERGWRGINIDARPGSKVLFDRERQGDVNLELAISSKKEVLTYHVVEGLPGANSLSADFLHETGDLDKVVERIEMETMPLAEVLDQYVPPGTSLDLLNVDVEGLDYEVLSSNDWEKYQPKVVVVELKLRSISPLPDEPVINLLRELDYELVAKTYLRNDVGSFIWVR